MNKGTIAYLGKGFGFLKIEGRAKDLFFHASGLGEVNFSDLKINDLVVFDEIDETEKGPAAIGVRFAEEA
jgi:cold shock CspA family protein